MAWYGVKDKAICIFNNNAFDTGRMHSLSGLELRLMGQH